MFLPLMLVLWPAVPVLWAVKSLPAWQPTSEAVIRWAEVSTSLAMTFL